MKIFCYIPAVCLQEGEISSQVRSLLARALKDGVTPIKVPGITEGVAVTLDEEVVLRLKSIGAEFAMAPGRVVGGMLYAQHMAGRSTKALSTDPVPCVMNLRVGQIRCIEEAAPMMRAGKIILAECGTGSGKGRLIAHAAAHALQLRNAGLLPSPASVSVLRNPPKTGNQNYSNRDLPDFIREHAAVAQSIQADRRAALGAAAAPVIICAPSIENVTHLVREWNACSTLFAGQGPISGALLLGRKQFVNPTLLLDLLSENEAPPAIADWLNSGMPAGIAPSTTYLKAFEPKLRGLMADLEYLANGTAFAFQDAELDEDAEADDQSVYAELRASAATADIIFTTHSMVCLDNMSLASTEWPHVLPPPCALFIDEAHDFEKNQAATASNSLSFQRLFQELNKDIWASIKKEAPSKAALATARKAVQAMSSLPDDLALPIDADSLDYRTQQEWKLAVGHLSELAVELKHLKTGLAKKKVGLTGKKIQAIRYIERAAAVLDNMVDGYRGFISHSPVKGRISFNIGPSSVEKFMSARWETTPTAMLLSGTLMHIGVNGGTITGYAKEIASPLLRTAATTPIHPGWITNTPTLYTPSPSIFHRLVPPRADDANPLSLAAWLADCAQVINGCAESAKGGMLVLMTGYERLEGLGASLLEMFPALRERLVIQSRHQRVSACAAEFKSKKLNGINPIWLGTGAAWTGLDLADERVTDDKAHEDVLLTDLVIPAMPFGLDRTTTHVARVNRTGFGPESRATQKRTRQALGRLIRREGLLSRRIWVLDGRLQHPACAHFTADLNRVLLQYIHREAFEMDIVSSVKQQNPRRV